MRGVAHDVGFPTAPDGFFSAEQVAYGRRRYGKDYPFVRFQRLDIEQEREALSDGLPSACDVVLAANVLHATQCVRNTIQHVKALLKRHGLLILNEITTLESFATLTFGLLEGWRRYQDAGERMPGGPLLSAPMWHRLLEEEGFHNVFLGENCWYAIRISGGKLNKIKYIAGYQTNPVSAITHYAEVESIEPYGDGGKYKLNFSGPAKEIEPIPFGNAPTGTMQGPRYTTIDRLLEAKQLMDLFK